MAVKLRIADLHVEADGKEIIRGLNLEVKQGEIHAIMGPNGSGKSTLASTIMGHPKFKVSRGKILLAGEDILGLSPDERARKGIFLAFQYPLEVPGVKLANFLRAALNSSGKKSLAEFNKLLDEKMALLQIDSSFKNRSINEGFSGGEKKRAEILQLAMLEPKIAILDETDSGLDVDSLKIVAEGLKKISGPKMGVVLITHYPRILHYIRPDFVHVMIDGRIIKTGSSSLAEQVEKKGYDWLRTAR